MDYNTEKVSDQRNDQKELERLFERYKFQHGDLRETVNELYSLSNRLKLRDPQPISDTLNKKINDSDIVGSFWTESYKLEDLNEELKEITRHLNSVI